MTATTTVFPTDRRNPWHTIGTDVTGMGWDEALTVADMRYTVEKHQIDASVIDDNGVGIVNLPDHRATIARYDDGRIAPLGVVGKAWHPVQISTMQEIVQDIVGASNGVVGAIGQFREGRTAFMQVDLPRSLQIGGTDHVGLSILAFNAFDGTSALRLAVTPTRLRCTNMLRLAFRTAVSSYVIRHTSGADARIAQARKALGVADAYADAFQKIADRLADTAMSDAAYEQFVERLVPAPENPEDQTAHMRTRVANARGSLMTLWTADTQAPIAGTRWAALNAVSEYDQWTRQVRGGDSPEVARAARMMDRGNGAIVDRAQRLLTRDFAGAAA